MSSPQTREFLRQSRERCRLSGEKNLFPTVTVHVSPKNPTCARTPNTERIQRLRDGEEEYIKFVCKEGEEIFVPQNVCCTSGFVNPSLRISFASFFAARAFLAVIADTFSEPNGCTQLRDVSDLLIPIFSEPQFLAELTVGRLVRRMFEGNGIYKERVDKTVKLPTFSALIVERVFQYCFEDFILNQSRSFTKVRRSLLFTDDAENNDDLYGVTKSFGDLHISSSIAIPQKSLSSSPGSLSSSSGSSFGLSASPYASPLKLFSEEFSPFRSSPKKSKKASRVVFCFEMSPSDVMEIAIICHFLDIPDLLDISCKMIASHIEGLETLEGIPGDLLCRIYSNLAPDQLAAIVSSPLHTESHPDLDLSSLWLDAVDKKGWQLRDLLSLASCVWSDEVRSTRLLMDDELIGDILALEVAEEFGGFDWKTMYLQMEFQHRLKNFSKYLYDLCESDNCLRRQSPHTAASTSKTNLEILQDTFNLSKDYLHYLRLCPSFLEASGLDLFHFIIESSALTSLNIHGNIMNAQRMTRLANLLSLDKLPKLRCFVLSHTGLTDETFGILLDFLETTQSSLTRLDLSDNKLTLKSLTRLALYLKTPECRLEYLSLSGNNVSHAAFQNLRIEDEREGSLSWILNCLKDNTTIRLLDLSSNEINLCHCQESEFVNFSKNTSLSYLFLNNNRLVVDDKSFAWFRVFVWNLPPISHLNLSFVGLETLQTNILCDALLERPKLRHLDLSDNMIGRESAETISLFLRRSSSLRSLVLSKNHLWDVGGRQISQTIGNSKSLVSLKLDGNKLGSSVQNIVQACHKAKKETLEYPLAYLDLSNNNISGQAMSAVKTLLSAEGTYGLRIQLTDPLQALGTNVF